MVATRRYITYYAVSDMTCKKCKKEIPDDAKYCQYCGANQTARQKPRKRSRRPNKAGGIYKLPGNRAKPWAARITRGYDEDGRQIKQFIGSYRTAADAAKALAQYEPDAPLSQKKNITLKELYEDWKQMPAYTRLSRSTQQNYDAAFERYMFPFHTMRFADLRIAEFQKMVNLAKDKGLSRSTLEKIKALGVILGKYAYSLDIVNKVYATAVVLPRAEKSDPETFTDAEVQKIMSAAAQGVPYADTVAIFLYTGMRISELLTLEKSGVDIKEMLITGGLKTDAGRDRVIPIHSRIQQYVRVRYMASEKYLIERPVVTGRGKNKIEVRKPISPGYYRDKIYYPLIDGLGIPRKTPHKTRHTFFTRFDAATDDKKAMADIGGHSDPNFSESVYVHPDIERLRKALEEID